MPAEKLHDTLAFLGVVAFERLEALKRSAGSALERCWPDFHLSGKAVSVLAAHHVSAIEFFYLWRSGLLNFSTCGRSGLLLGLSSERLRE